MYVLLKTAVRWAFRSHRRTPQRIAGDQHRDYAEDGQYRPDYPSDIWFHSELPVNFLDADEASLANVCLRDIKASLKFTG